MTPLRPLVWATLALLLAAAFQGRTAHALHLHWAQPDFILVTLGCAATLVGGSRGAFLGLWAGLLTAVLIPGTFGTFLTSRTLAGALAAYLQRLLIRDSVLVPPLAVLATTVAAEGVYVLMAPGLARHSFRLWFAGVAGETLYNMAFSLPIYFLLRRLGLGQVPDDPFGTRG